MGQCKSVLVFGIPSTSGLQRDEDDELMIYDPARKIGRKVGLSYGHGQDEDWAGFVVQDEDDVYSGPMVDVADLLAGTSPLSPRLTQAREAWDQLRGQFPDLPEGRLLLVGDYEVA